MELKLSTLDKESERYEIIQTFVNDMKRTIEKDKLIRKELRRHKEISR